MTCGQQHHHDPHFFEDMYGESAECEGVAPARTAAEAVGRLREWASVESVPAQNEFNDILADLERLTT